MSMLHMASLEFIAPPPPQKKKNIRSPVDTKGLPLIYLVGPLAISEPHINICVRTLNTCVALKQYNSLPPNTWFLTKVASSCTKVVVSTFYFLLYCLVSLHVSLTFCIALVTAIVFLIVAFSFF